MAYNQLYTKYKDDLHIYQKQKQAIINISDYIVYTTLIAYLPLIDGLDIVYKRLQALKHALAPTTSGHKRDALVQYAALKTYNKRQNIDKWLNSQRNTYKLAKQLELLDVQGYQPHYDFIQVINPITPTFAGALEANLIRREWKDKDTLFIIQLIKEFKEHYQIQKTVSLTTSVNHSAFATL